MARMRSRKGLIVTAIVLGIVLLAVGAIVLKRNVSQPSKVVTTDTSKPAVTTSTKDTTTQSSPADSTASTTSTPAVDPASLKSIAIEPLGVSVFYTKGTPGFEYTVLKTANKTQYVQFTSSDLVGTKCTDDQGAFASILKNPSADELQTTSQTVKVGNDTYGLSLASDSCTGDTTLLATYQDGFKNGFSSLATL